MATLDYAQNQVQVTPDEDVRSLQFPLVPLLVVLGIALIGRAIVLLSGSVSFHSDEAVIGLMARHIIDGARPVFFYGQAYMGSLDAWLVSFGFRLFGDSVMTIRLVQAVLYLLVVLTGFLAAWRLSERTVVATVAGLLLALHPVLMAVYTSATLGGYNETLLFGNLMLILGFEATHRHTNSLWRWGLLGVVAGLAWWTNGLIIAFVFPVGLMVLAHLYYQAKTGGPTALASRLIPLAVALVGFFIGSAPWWIFNFQNDWAALAFYIERGDNSEFAGNAVPELTTEQRVLGLLFLGIPTLIGLRFPWSAEFFLPLIGAIVLFIYGVAFYRLVRDKRGPDGTPPLKPEARPYILWMIFLFVGLFFVSKFSIDPTGRYFLPLMVPLAIVIGALVDSVPRQRLPRRVVQGAILVIILGYNIIGQVVAISQEPGLTTQFNLDSHIPNTHDQELIAFLDEQGIQAGYGTYWVTFRLAFLSNEQMQFSSALPYKPSLQYTEADERYPAYKVAADNAENVAYITANVPAVEQALEAVFADQGVTYTDEQIGSYRVYYDFEPFVPRPPLPLHRFDDETNSD